MASIEWTNRGEVMARMKAREEKLKSAPKIARQMGILALNEIHPLTHKKSNTWDNSIHAEVHEVKSFVWELWVGSKGAFNGAGYNYGKRQEDLYHPIETGWFKAWPRMMDLFNEKMKGIVTANADMADFAGLDVGEW